jgi:hypothetical protein
MDFFLLSAEAEKDIDWYFYTDCGLPSFQPENMTFIEMSFRDYTELVSERLEVDYNPQSAYKLCDLKPMLGYVHQEVVAGYDFWAFADIDLIFGRVSDYLAEQKQQEFDTFSLLINRICGHMTWFKVDDRLNNAFRRSDKWQADLCAEEPRAFDEKSFTKVYLKRRKWPLWLNKLVYRNNDVLQRSMFLDEKCTPNGSDDWSSVGGYPEEWYWQQGVLTNNIGRATPPYFHFMHWKGVWSQVEDTASLINVNIEDARQHGFKITKGGFYPLVKD